MCEVAAQGAPATEGDFDSGLRAVVVEVREAGLDSEKWLPELPGAELLSQLAERHVALQELEDVLSGDVVVLEEALGRARAVGLPKGSACTRAEQRLEQLQSLLDDSQVPAPGADGVSSASLTRMSKLSCASAVSVRRSKLLSLDNSEELKARHDALLVLHRLTTSVDSTVLAAALEQAEAVGLPTSVLTRALEQRLKRLLLELPLIATMQVALEVGAGHDDRVKGAMAELDIAGVASQSKSWLPELPGSELAAALSARRNAVRELEIVAAGVDRAMLRHALEQSRVAAVPQDGSSTAQVKAFANLELVDGIAGMLQSVYPVAIAVSLKKVNDEHLDLDPDLVSQLERRERHLIMQLPLVKAMGEIVARGLSETIGKARPPPKNSCALRLPKVGDIVTRKVKKQVKADTEDGREEAWVLRVNQPATVVKVDKDDDFKLRNAMDIVSGWQFRKFFIYKEEEVDGDGSDEKLQAVVKAVHAAGLARKADQWLPDLPGPVLYNEVAKRHDALSRLFILKASTDLSAIEQAMRTARYARLTGSAAARALQARAQLLQVQLPIVESMSAAPPRDGWPNKEPTSDKLRVTSLVSCRTASQQSKHSRAFSRSMSTLRLDLDGALRTAAELVNRRWS